MHEVTWILFPQRKGLKRGSVSESGHYTSVSHSPLSPDLFVHPRSRVLHQTAVFLINFLIYFT